MSDPTPHDLGIGRRRGGRQPTVDGGRKATYFVSAANIVTVEAERRRRRGDSTDELSASEAVRGVLDDWAAWLPVILKLKERPGLAPSDSFDELAALVNQANQEEPTR